VLSREAQARQSSGAAGDSGGGGGDGATGSASAGLGSAGVCKVCDVRFGNKSAHTCRRCAGQVCGPCSVHSVGVHETRSAFLCLFFSFIDSINHHHHHHHHRHQMALPEENVFVPFRVCDSCFFAQEILDPASVKGEVHRSKIQEIEDKFADKIDIATPNRRFFKAGPLMKVCRKEDRMYYFFLFDDALLYAERKAGRYHLHRDLSLAGTTIEDTGYSDRSLDPNLAFQIRASEKSFVVFAKTQREKTAWMMAIVAATELFNREHPELAMAAAPAAPVWQPDKLVKACTICAKKFTLTNRRHHCRLCGCLCCNLCSKVGVHILFYSCISEEKKKKKKKKKKEKKLAYAATLLVNFQLINSTGSRPSSMGTRSCARARGV
jgi:hypothetical protein